MSRLEDVFDGTVHSVLILVAFLAVRWTNPPENLFFLSQISPQYRYASRMLK